MSRHQDGTLSHFFLLILCIQIALANVYFYQEGTESLLRRPLPQPRGARRQVKRTLA